jgi:hypothetical protein
MLNFMVDAGKTNVTLTADNWVTAQPDLRKQNDINRI